jgi:predicted nucleic acid-binding protein
MIHGMDTGFLVSAELVEHPDHLAARTTLSRLLAEGDRIALAPQVLAEFIHIVTDSRRFRQPVGIGRARKGDESNYWGHWGHP